MKAYTNVSRKTVGEDRVAICPIFGCEFISRVKPLKFGFLGFGKYPKCKKHRIPLVYIDERINDFVDAALACLFDKSGLPPSELHESIKSKFPDEFNSFIEGWVYCITVGRGAPIVSHYMDAISNAYLKQLTKKQIKALKKGDGSKPNLVNKAIKEGMDEITIQYTRVLKHLRAHSEILIEHQKLKSLSKSLPNCLNDWQKNILKRNEIINSSENKREMALKEIKFNYDQILNVGICRCLLGLNPESKELKKAKITAFDRFSAYHEFYNEGLTVKFTKSDIRDLYLYNKETRKNLESSKFSKQEIEFLKRNGVDIENLGSRWAWIEGNHTIIEKYFRKIIIPYFKHVPSSSELKKNGYARLVNYIYSMYPNYKEFVSKVINEEYRPYYRKIPYDTIEIIKQITDSYVDSFLRNNKLRLPPTINNIIENYKLGITPNTFKNHALKYLENQFGKENGNVLFFQMWGSTKISPFKIEKIREIVQKAIIDYENEKIKPQSLYKLSKKLDMSWRTFSRHAREYLEDNYNKSKAEFFYNTFWEIPAIENLPKAKIELIYKITNYELELFHHSNKLYDPTSIAELSSIEDLEIKPDTFRKYARRYLISKFGKTKSKEIFTEMWPGSGQNISRQIINNIKNIVHIEIDKYITYGNNEQIPPLSNLSSRSGISVSDGTFIKYAKEYLYDKFGDYGYILYSKLWPNDINTLRANAGRIFHLLLNYLLTSFFNQLGIHYFSEVPIYPGARRPDGLIIIEENNNFFSEIKSRLISLLQIKYPIIQGLKAIVFDFTSDMSDSNIIRKIKKYQNSEILLLIVGYRWYFTNNIRRLPKDNSIMYPHNIRIIKLDLFFNAFKITQDYISKINVFKDFVTNYDLENLNKAKFTERTALLGKSKLKKYLKKKLLIKENISEFFPYGIRDYPIKDSLNKTEMEEIRQSQKSSKIALIDIETTSFIKKNAFIVEIGIVELDFLSGEKRIIFNSPIYEKGVENYSGMGAFSISNLDLSDVKNAKNLESCRETLQLIFDQYKIISYNTRFDLGILESRGFIFPKKLMDLMIFTRKILPKGKYNFEFAYRKFHNSQENEGGKYLKNKNYEEQHRAVDDAVHEAELLFLFIYKYNFPTSFQSQIKKKGNKNF